MPYIQRKLDRDLDPKHFELVETLRRELQPPTLGSNLINVLSAPVIIEEQMRNSNYLQVFVKWDRWLGVRENHRTAAILDAYEKALGTGYAARIVMALGLTSAEAAELGVRES